MDAQLATVLIVLINMVGSILLAYIKAKWPSAHVSQDEVKANGRPNGHQGATRS